jgi:DNA polymerase III subunit gamma/tau
MEVKEPYSLKYRPKKLSEVIGQPVVVQAFENAFKNNTLHHAYILAGNTGNGKCIAGDTLILTKNGLKYIKDVVPDKEGISSINLKVIDDQGVGTSSLGYHEKNVKTKIITNSLGIKIEGTLEHPIKIFNEDKCSIEWKLIKDLKNGDIIPVYRNLFKFNKNKKSVLTHSVDNLKEEYFEYKAKDLKEKVVCPICNKQFLQMNTHLRVHNISLEEFKKKYGEKYLLHGKEFYKNNIKNNIKDISLPLNVSKEFARFLGYIISEGNIHENTVVFTNSSQEVLKDFEKITYNLFNIKIDKKEDKRKKGLYTCRANSALLVYYLKKMGGIDYKSAKKHIPEELFSWNYEFIVEFLKALFEGDGGINGGYISYYTISYRLATELQQILLTIGIISSLKKEKKRCSNCVRKEGHISYSINISGHNSKIYHRKINFISIAKKNKLLNLIAKKSNTNNDVVPSIIKKIENIIKNNIDISKSGKIKINDKFYIVPRKPNSFAHIAGKNGGASYNKLKDIIFYLQNMINFLYEKNMDKEVLDNFKNILNICEQIRNNNFFLSKITHIEDNINDVYDICKEGDDKSFISNGFISHNTTVARIIAAMENCKNRGKDPCGICDNCKEIFTGKSNEVLEIDAGSEGKVDNIRALQKSLYQSPIECKTKYVLIDEAHSLSGSAAEASLKMIEEPPPYVRFLLLTTEPQAFKETIHNRCIMWKFNKVSRNDLFAHLRNIAEQEGLSCDDKILQLIARYSKGSVRNSLQNLQTIVNYVGDDEITLQSSIESLGVINDDLYFELIDGIIEKNTMKCFMSINKMFSDGKEVKIIFDGVCEHLNNLLIIRTCKNNIESFDYTKEETKRYFHQNSKIKTGDNILKMMNLLSTKVSFGIEYSVNPVYLFNKFSVESMMISAKK